MIHRKFKLRDNFEPKARLVCSCVFNRYKNMEDGLSLFYSSSHILLFGKAFPQVIYFFALSTSIFPVGGPDSWTGLNYVQQQLSPVKRFTKANHMTVYVHK